MMEFKALVAKWRKRDVGVLTFWRDAADELEAWAREEARPSEPDVRNFPWFGCTGKGRPSCAATECMYGLDAKLKPKAQACAFVEQAEARVEREDGHD